MAAHNKDPLLGIDHASLILGISENRLRYLAQAGDVVPDECSTGGMRFFRQSTVEKYAAQRRKAHAQRVGRRGRPIKLPPDNPPKPWEADNDK